MWVFNKSLFEFWLSIPVFQLIFHLPFHTVFFLSDHFSNLVVKCSKNPDWMQPSISDQLLWISFVDMPLGVFQVTNDTLVETFQIGALSLAPDLGQWLIFQAHSTVRKCAALSQSVLIREILKQAETSEGQDRTGRWCACGCYTL